MKDSGARVYVCVQELLGNVDEERKDERQREGKKLREREMEREKEGVQRDCSSSKQWRWDD